MVVRVTPGMLSGQGGYASVVWVCLDLLMPVVDCSPVILNHDWLQRRFLGGIRLKAFHFCQQLLLEVVLGGEDVS